MKYPNLYRCRLLLGCVSLLWIAGCSEPPTIAVYEVPKVPVPQTHRMLGAIVPRADSAWFFKVTGKREEVDTISEAFQTFLKTVDFADGSSEPRWELPDQWKQRPGDQLRFATIEIPAGDARLELTVSTLPWRGDAEQQFVSNINRWRGQLGLPRIGRSQLETLSTSLDLPAGKARAVDLLGSLKESQSMRHPTDMAKPSPRASVPPADSGEGRDVRFDPPEGWVKGAGSGLSIASYEVTKDGKTVKITVTPLGTAGADLTANVNRWRQQIGLPAVSAQEIEASAKKLPVAGAQADYVELFGEPGKTPSQAILAAIVRIGDTAYFFKLMGDADVAKGEQERFQEFVKSMKP